MPLIVTYLTGPQAGQDTTLEGAEVRFGRDPAAEVGFPAELDIVGRDHFRLRREVGAWKFVIAKQRPVYAGGRPLLDGEELDGALEVTLAHPGGPRLRLDPREGAGGNMPKTRVLSAGQDIGDVADASRRGGRRLALWLGAVTLVVAAVAGGYLLLRQQVGTVAGETAAMKQQLADVAGRLPSVEEQVAAIKAKSDALIDSQAVLGKVSRSVYQVAIEGKDGVFFGMGTASVVMLPDGQKALMTNAHISEPVIKYLANPDIEAVWVIQPKGPDYPRLRVVAAKTHPAYNEFTAWAERLTALRGEGRVRGVKINGAGYDVGLLTVDHPEALADPLTLASPEELAALDTGTPLVMTGYPESGVNGTDLLRPEPTGRTGAITAVTTFYLFRSNKQPNLLIQHSMPTAGGASGSPMFNAAGHVVGLHDATGWTYASYALINYGQRIDLLKDLMDGSAAGKIDGYRAEWAAAETQLTQSNPDAILSDAVNQFAEEAGAPVERFAEQDFTMDQKRPESDKARGVTFGATLQPGVSYLLAAVSADGRPITMTAYVKNEPVAGSVGGFFISDLRLQNPTGEPIDVSIGVLDESSLTAEVPAGKITMIGWRATGAGG